MPLPLSPTFASKVEVLDVVLSEPCLTPFVFDVDQLEHAKLERQFQVALECSATKRKNGTPRESKQEYLLRWRHLFQSLGHASRDSFVLSPHMHTPPIHNSPLGQSNWKFYGWLSTRAVTLMLNCQSKQTCRTEVVALHAKEWLTSKSPSAFTSWRQHVCAIVSMTAINYCWQGLL